MTTCSQNVVAAVEPVTRSPEGRGLFARVATGDLVDELHGALDADAATDPLLGSGTDHD